MTYTRLNISLSLLVIVSFMLGFIFQENSSGGATDLKHYFSNFKLFYGNNLLKVDWDKYESTSLPLYYIVTYFFYNPENLILIKIFNLLLSIFSFLIFYEILKSHLSLNKSLAFLLSCTILLSPYFRTSTYWMMEENFPIFMTFLTIYFYFKFKDNLNNLYLLFAVFFSVCAFFSRQSYIIISFGLFLLIFDWNSFFSKKNYFILLLFIIFFSPTLYFFQIWNGLLPPAAVLERGVFNSLNEINQKGILIFNANNIPHILNILLIYLLPFIYFEKKNFFKYINRNIILIIFLFIFYLLIFYNFESKPFGGGALNKLFFMLFNSEYIINYLNLIFSFFSLFLLLLLFKENKLIIVYFLLSITLFSTITPVWQEYFDPIVLIIIILFGNKLNASTQSNKFVYFLIIYLTIFLSASIIDQKYLVNI